MCIDDAADFPDLSERMADKLPVLVKKGNKVYVYSKKEDGVLGYIELEASKFNGIAFPQVGQTETKLGKTEISAEIYDEITSKGGYTHLDNRILL